jgi:hypothetical protein
VKINLRKYKLERIDGKFEKIPIFESKFKTWIKSIILFCFKKINYRHMNIKDHNDKPMISEILDIRGIRTCAYESSGGQVYIAQFMWKFGKYYI